MSSPSSGAFVAISNSTAGPRGALKRCTVRGAIVTGSPRASSSVRK